MSPIFDPESWKRLAHGDADAWMDFAGTQALQHTAFDVAIRALGGVAYPILPLGSPARGTWLLGPDPEEDPERRRLLAIYPDDDWHSAHQLRHDGEARALLIAEAPDLLSYDLTDPDQFATYTYLHAAEHIRLRQAIGI